MNYLLIIIIDLGSIEFFFTIMSDHVSFSFFLRMRHFRVNAVKVTGQLLLCSHPRLDSTLREVSTARAVADDRRDEVKEERERKTEK